MIKIQKMKTSKRRREVAGAGGAVGPEEGLDGRRIPPETLTRGLSGEDARRRFWSTQRRAPKRPALRFAPLLLLLLRLC